MRVLNFVITLHIKKFIHKTKVVPFFCLMVYSFSTVAVIASDAINRTIGNSLHRSDYFHSWAPTIFLQGCKPRDHSSILLIHVDNYPTIVENLTPSCYVLVL